MASNPSKSKGPDSNEKKVVPPGLYVGAALMAAVGVGYAANAIMGSPDPDNRSKVESAIDYRVRRAEGELNCKDKKGNPVPFNPFFRVGENDIDKLKKDIEKALADTRAKATGIVALPNPSGEGIVTCEAETKESKGKLNEPGHIRGQNIAQDRHTTQSNPTPSDLLSSIYNGECAMNALGHPDGDNFRGKDFLRPGKERDATSFRAPRQNGQPGELFIYHDNLHEFVSEARKNLTILATLHDRYITKETKKSIEWFMSDYKPPEDKKAELKAFEKYVDEYLLKQPLVCARWTDPDRCMVDYEGRECLFVKPLADMITSINARVYSTDKVQMRWFDCFRPFKRQAIIFDSCEVNEKKKGHGRPGNSNHNFGLAGDMANPDKFKDALEEKGIICGIKSAGSMEDGHCALGENGGSKGFIQDIWNRVQ